MKITKGQLRSLIREAIAQHYVPGLPMAQLPKTKGIGYTALVLDRSSQQLLLPYVPPDWKPIAHHMTMITPRTQKQGRIPARWLGQNICVQAVGIIQDERVMAAVIDTSSTNILMRGPVFPHVTIAVNTEMGGKPYMSNELSLDNITQIEPLTLCGLITEL